MRMPYLEIGKEVFAPVVKIGLKAAGRWIETEAYVDSGASYSIFKSEVADICCFMIQKYPYIDELGSGKL